MRWSNFGRHRSQALAAIQVANASLSHRSSHHHMVTRLPNQWWAISWAITSAMDRSRARVRVFSSARRSSSRKVMSPAFSMAPAPNSGTATTSSLG